MDCADSPVNLEQQISDGLPWVDVSKHELRYDIISRLLQRKSNSIIHSNEKVVHLKDKVKQNVPK